MKKFLAANKNTLLFIQIILTIIGISMTLYSFVLEGVNVRSVLYIALYILFAIYTIWGFKEPHSNSLRYLGLVLAISIIYIGMTVILTVEENMDAATKLITNKELTYTFLLSGVCVAYVSGRLHRYKSNSVILIFVTIILLFAISRYQNIIGAVLDTLEVNDQTRIATHFVTYNPAILVGTFEIAYLTRYEQHIKAGMVKDQDVFKD